MMTRKVALSVALALAAAPALGGCIDKQLLYYYDTPVAASEAAGGGSAVYCTGSLLPLAQELAGGGAAALVVGKDAAIEAVLNGEARFALIDAEGYEPGDYPELAYTAVGAEGARFIVSEESDVDDVSIDEAYALFTGEDASLTIALQAKGGAGRNVFEDIFGLKGTVNGMVKSLIPADALTAEDDAGVAAIAAADAAVIGAVSLDFEGGGVKTVSLEGAYPDDEEYLARRAVLLVYRADAAGSAEELLQNKH